MQSPSNLGTPLGLGLAQLPQVSPPRQQVQPDWASSEALLEQDHTDGGGRSPEGVRVVEPAGPPPTTLFGAPFQACPVNQCPEVNGGGDSTCEKDPLSA